MKKNALVLIAVLAGLFLMISPVKAELIVTSCKVEPDVLVAGEHFKVTVIFNMTKENEEMQAYNVWAYGILIPKEARVTNEALEWQNADTEGKMKWSKKTGWFYDPRWGSWKEGLYIFSPNWTANLDPDSKYHGLKFWGGKGDNVKLDVPLKGKNQTLSMDFDTKYWSEGDYGLTIHMYYQPGFEGTSYPYTGAPVNVSIVKKK